MATSSPNLSHAAMTVAVMDSPASLPAHPLLPLLGLLPCMSSETLRAFIAAVTALSTTENLTLRAHNSAGTAADCAIAIKSAAGFVQNIQHVNDAAMDELADLFTVKFVTHRSQQSRESDNLASAIKAVVGHDASECDALPELYLRPSKEGDWQYLFEREAREREARIKQDQAIKPKSEQTTKAVQLYHPPHQFCITAIIRKLLLRARAEQLLSRCGKMPCVPSPRHTFYPLRLTPISVFYDINLYHHGLTSEEDMEMSDAPETKGDEEEDVEMTDSHFETSNSQVVSSQEVDMEDASSEADLDQVADIELVDADVADESSQEVLMPDAPAAADPSGKGPWYEAELERERASQRHDTVMSEAPVVASTNPSYCEARFRRVGGDAPASLFGRDLLATAPRNGPVLPKWWETAMEIDERQTTGNENQTVPVAAQSPASTAAVSQLPALATASQSRPLPAAGSVQPARRAVYRRPAPANPLLFSTSKKKKDPVSALIKPSQSSSSQRPTPKEVPTKASPSKSPASPPPATSPTSSASPTSSVSPTSLTSSTSSASTARSTPPNSPETSSDADAELTSCRKRKAGPDTPTKSSSLTSPTRSDENLVLDMSTAATQAEPCKKRKTEAACDTMSPFLTVPAVAKRGISSISTEPGEKTESQRDAKRVQVTLDA